MRYIKEKNILYYIMSSDTSSDNEININYLDKNGNKLLSERPEIKKQSSDTDYYFNMIANNDKIINSNNNSESESNININSEYNISSSTTKSSSKSKSRFENINLSNEKFTMPNVSEYETKYNEPKYTETKYNEPKYTDTKNVDPIPNLFKSAIPILTQTAPSMTPQEIKMKKIELLRRLCEIKAKGYQLTKDYDFNSSIEEMEYEYSLLKSFADKRNGVKLYKSCLLNGISVMEFMNDKYDPFDFKLNGWSEHMSIEVDTYDDIFEELYEKYKSKGTGLPVEVKLLLLIVASGASFHFSKTQLGTIPASMLGKMMSTPKEKSQFMTPQEVNLENQKKIIKEKEAEMKKKTTQVFNKNQPIINKSGPSRDMPDIRAPENVQEILNRIKNIQENQINTTETQEESTINNDRIISDSTISDRKKIKKSKKPLLSIAT